MFGIPEDGMIDYDKIVHLDLADVQPCVAGPKRPQDRIPLCDLKKSVAPGAIVIAAITSCTNTSNPSVMIQAGLLAKKALERGLTVKARIKTSLAPGSRIVTDYLNKAGLSPFLDQLGFHLVGYGCTTCIGNSGDLDAGVAQAIQEGRLAPVSVLSGNRNFEARVHGAVKANFLMSPPLVVAFAIAGRIDIDMDTEPLGLDTQGNHVYLRDIWPSKQEIDAAHVIDRESFKTRYAHIFSGGPLWDQIPEQKGPRFSWDPQSTYIRRPPYFEAAQKTSFTNLRTFALLGDSVTTDHISPAGAIGAATSAGQYLLSLGVQQKDFNSYGARRGNHEVMLRGTFFGKYPRQENGLIFAGRDYGMGSSRDWAAKGPALLGIKVVVARSFERIHRSNLIGMGVLPLCFLNGETWETHGIQGDETFTLHGADTIAPRQRIVLETSAGKKIDLVSAIDTPAEVEYFLHGGILPYALSRLTAASLTISPANEPFSRPLLPCKRVLTK